MALSNEDILKLADAVETVRAKLNLKTLASFRDYLSMVRADEYESSQFLEALITIGEVSDAQLEALKAGTTG